KQEAEDQHDESAVIVKRFGGPAAEHLADQPDQRNTHSIDQHSEWRGREEQYPPLAHWASYQVGECAREGEQADQRLESAARGLDVELVLIEGDHHTGS